MPHDDADGGDENHRDPESGRFTSPDGAGDDDGDRVDDHDGEDRAGQRGPPARPPARTMTEREILGFLEDVLAERDRWRGASTERPGGGSAPTSAARESHDDGRGGDDEQAERGTPTEACVLTQEDVDALEAEGYVVREQPPVPGRGRSSSPSYALVTVDEAEDADPARSVDEVLTAVVEKPVTDSPNDSNPK